MSYSVQQYRDNDTGRARWAVLHSKTGAWYFPARYGKAAAEKLCEFLKLGGAR